MRHYDIGIIGGGPAGLTAARVLGKAGRSVLLVEKERIGRRPRSWITWYDDIVGRGYGDTVINKIESLAFRSFLGGEYIFDRIPSAIVDPCLLLERLCAQAKDAGVEIHEGETFLRYRPSGDACFLETDKNTCSCTYCIDASGVDSSVQRGLGGGLPGSCLMGCYALELDRLKIADPGSAFIFDAAFPGKDYFWFLPYSKTRALAGCFIFGELNGATRPRMKEALARYLRSMKIAGTVRAVVEGNIPLAERKYTRFGRIFFAGDALSSPLPSSGFGLLRTFAEAELLANDLVKGFSSGTVRYERSVIESRYPGYELHYLVADMLKNINDPLLDKGIRRMAGIDGGFIAHFLRGDDLSIGFSVQMLAAIRETYSLQEIASMALERDYKDMLLHAARTYPRATPAVIRKTLNGILSRFFKRKTGAQPGKN